MMGTRQTIQYSLALEPGDQGETPVSGRQGAEPLAARPAPESPASTEQLMEEVCDRENLVRAWKRVRQNKGSPGVDGMTIDDAKDYLRENWPNIRSQLLEGTYQPQPVKRIEIPKPDGGIRKLGVPCVVDRQEVRKQTSPLRLSYRWLVFLSCATGWKPARTHRPSFPMQLTKSWPAQRLDPVMKYSPSNKDHKSISLGPRLWINCVMSGSAIHRPADIFPTDPFFSKCQ